MGRRQRIASLALAGVAAACFGTGTVHAAPANPIAQAFPAQWKAVETSAVGSKHWALLIGISAYSGSTRDTIGGKRDALQLKGHLTSLGWREDHILTLTNANATKSMILGGLEWLRSKSSTGSTVVFAYAGHEMPFRTDADGDSEIRDVALHVYDNRYILDGDLARSLGAVRANAMWMHFATCRAGGFNDAGLMKAGRVATFSSPESELSYEDPDVNLSVFGRYTIGEAMRGELGDYNSDGLVSVEEAFKFGKPRVQQRTSDRQHPLMIDRLDGSLTLLRADPIS